MSSPHDRGALVYCTRYVPLTIFFPTFVPHSQLSTIESIAENTDLVAPNNAMNYLSDNGGKTYNLCHCAFLTPPFPAIVHVTQFWTNFEIADLDFWRGPTYTASEFLESRGYFYYEVSQPFLSSPAPLSDGFVWLRQWWSDVPVHSITAALFGEKDQIHFFREIRYEHPLYTLSCRENSWRRQGCYTCDPTQNFGVSLPFVAVFTD